MNAKQYSKQLLASQWWNELSILVESNVRSKMKIKLAQQWLSD